MTTPPTRASWPKPNLCGIRSFRPVRAEAFHRGRTMIREIDSRCAALPQRWKKRRLRPAGAKARWDATLYVAIGYFQGQAPPDAANVRQRRRFRVNWRPQFLEERTMSVRSSEGGG